MGEKSIRCLYFQVGMSIFMIFEINEICVLKIIVLIKIFINLIIYRPNGTVQAFDKSNNAPVIVSKPTFVEVHSKSDYVANTVRVHKNLPYIEFDFVIGPIPVEDKLGKEIISVYKTDLKTNGELYTDANGRQLLKRVRNQRPNYSYNSTDEPVASNYYPLNSKVELRDEEKQLRLAVLLDRSEGGASMSDGELEIMVHRRLMSDDAFGVGEALNEPGMYFIIKFIRFLILKT